MLDGNRVNVIKCNECDIYKRITDLLRFVNHERLEKRYKCRGSREGTGRSGVKGGDEEVGKKVAGTHRYAVLTMLS